MNHKMYAQLCKNFYLTMIFLGTGMSRRATFRTSTSWLSGRTRIKDVTGTPHFIGFLYCPPWVLQFLQTDGRPSTSKKITTHFIAISVLLWWPETKPTISPKYNCIVYLEH